MIVETVGIFAGLFLGTAWTAASALYLLLTRSSRKVKDPFVIGLGYLIIGAAGIGSLVVLLSLCDHLGIERRTSPYYAALFAYGLSTMFVTFFTGRGEMRWRKSVGLDRKDPNSRQESKI